MPKPNKYAGNGSKKSEGTVEGAYVMHKGRMVPNFKATNAAILKGINAYTSFKENAMLKITTRILCYVLIAAFLAALFGTLQGCQINVVNVIHSDIGLTAQSITAATE